MIPETYFYLVDIETDQPLAIFSADGCCSMVELNTLESRIRVEQGVDDPESGLALRDSGSAPLPAEVVVRVMKAMRR